MTKQPTTPAITYIAIDQELIESLRQTLEATQQELKRVTGSEPMSMKEAAAYLKVARSTLSDYIRRGQITPSEYGSPMWVTRNDLDAFIARHRRRS